jgi:hypothetical protein
LGIERCGKINASNSGAESWTGIGVVAGFGAVVLIMQWPHGKNRDVNWGRELLQILQEVRSNCKTRNQLLDNKGNKVWVPDVVRASLVCGKLYEFLKAQGFSPTWSSVGSVLVWIGSLITSLVGGFEVLSKVIKIVKNKAR